MEVIADETGANTTAMSAGNHSVHSDNVTGDIGAVFEVDDVNTEYSTKHLS